MDPKLEDIFGPLQGGDVFGDVFDDEQQGHKYEVNARIMLQDTFKKKWYPSVQDQIAIANLTNLDREQVKFWFENERRKMRLKHNMSGEQMKNIRKIDEGVFLKDVYKVLEPTPYMFQRTRKAPTEPLQNVQPPVVPLQQPHHQEQPHQQEQPQEQPREALLPPQPRKVYLEKRKADDLSYRDSKVAKLEEENRELKKMQKFQVQQIFAQAEKMRSMEVGFAQAEKMRSIEVKLATLE